MTREQIDWIINAALAIHKAGGRPDYLLREIPLDLIDTLSRNNIQLIYQGPRGGQ